jgi:hypothetical protein
LKRICVFCGSSNGARDTYVAAAQQIGAGLARRGLEVVFGGGRVGLMGAVADAALDAGGRVIGVIPKALMDKELAHQRLIELHVVRSMHERKALMADLADGFIALPGGFGTLEEFCEIFTWTQLGFHNKPCGILNVDGYYDTLLRFFDQTVTEGFVRVQHRALILTANDTEHLLDQMLAAQPPLVDKWLERGEL